MNPTVRKIMYQVDTEWLRIEAEAIKRHIDVEELEKRIVKEGGLPEEFSGWMKGSTAEEIRKDADKMRDLFQLSEHEGSEKDPVYGLKGLVKQFETEPDTEALMKKLEERSKDK